MKKKPSETIKKRLEKRGYRTDDGTIPPMEQEIFRHLDEERERVDSILHEIASALFETGLHQDKANYIHDMIDGTLSGNEK